MQYRSENEIYALNHNHCSLGPVLSVRLFRRFLAKGPLAFSIAVLLQNHMKLYIRKPDF